jgi:hypothetical protein
MKNRWPPPAAPPLDLPTPKNDTTPCVDIARTPHSRRAWLRTGLGLLGGVTLGRPFVEHPVLAQRQDFDDTYTAEVDAAVEAGLDFLVSRQIASGGFETIGWGENAAVCSLAGIAMLGRGVRPGIGPRGKMLAQLGNLILANCQDSGLIQSPGRTSHGEMYEHGFSTLFLAEYYGADPATTIHPKLVAAVQLILGSQNDKGGWRYEPRPNESDLSVTVCQMMALRAAKNAGITVPNEIVEQGIEYIQNCQNADGGFMYRQTGGESRYPLTAAAIVALNNAGIYESDELSSAFGYLDNQRTLGKSRQSNSYFFYSHYYSVQAYWNRGGKPWRDWYAQLRSMLLPIQQSDGSWQDYHSSEYGTAMACIILNMPRTVLPIFQR